MRLLFFSQGYTPEDQIGFDDGFRRLHEQGVLSAYRCFPWRGYAREHGWHRFFEEGRRCTEDFEPDIVYLQYFHEPACPDAAEFIASLRKPCSAPVIAVSAGDAFSWNHVIGKRYPRGFLSAARSADVVFVTALGRCADFLAAKGVKNIVLMPLGACQVRYKPQALDAAGYRPDYDVAFIGSGCWRRRNLLNYSCYSGLRRRALVRALSRRYGKRFALYGRGWEGIPAWKGVVPFDEQLNVCRNARVLFGGFPGSSQDYYTSDRPFIQITSGVPYVDWRVARVDRLLRDQDHWFLVSSETGMLRQIDALLEGNTAEHMARAATAAEYVHANLSQHVLASCLVETMAQCHRARRAGRPAPMPAFPFFLPEVDREREQPFCLRNWRG